MDDDGVYVVGTLVGLPKPYPGEKKTYYSAQVSAGEITEVGVSVEVYTELGKHTMKPVVLRCRATRYGLKDGELVGKGSLQKVGA